MPIARDQSAVESIEGKEPTSRRSALKLGLTGAGLAAGGAALANVLTGAPAGATGNNNVTVLQVTWNGQTATLTAVLPDGYDPTVGGVVSGVMTLGEKTITCPLVQLDSSATVIQLIEAVDTNTATDNVVWIANLDGEGNRIPWGAMGLTQTPSTGNPGDVNPDGVAATIGMITPDSDGSLWVCSSSAPGATWHHFLVVYTDTVGGPPSSDGAYVGQLATDGGNDVIYMWNGSSWLSTTLS